MHGPDHILLVEDDTITSYLHERLIKKIYPEIGIKITRNGEDALNYLKNCLDHQRPLPKLILLDLNMPVMDGYEFLRIFTRLETPVVKDIPVVVVTSSDSGSDKERVNRLGASSYLSKPLCKEMVEGILENKYAA